MMITQQYVVMKSEHFLNSKNSNSKKTATVTRVNAQGRKEEMNGGRMAKLN